MSPSDGSGTLGPSSMFSGVFMPKEDDGIADKVLGDSTTVHVQTPLGAFVNMSWRSAVSFMIHFSDKR
jgi:hypothetical protein